LTPAARRDEDADHSQAWRIVHLAGYGEKGRSISLSQKDEEEEKGRGMTTTRLHLDRGLDAVGRVAGARLRRVR